MAYPTPDHFVLHRIDIVGALVGFVNCSSFMGALRMECSHYSGIDGDSCLSVGKPIFRFY